MSLALERHDRTDVTLAERRGDDAPQNDDASRNNDASQNNDAPRISVRLELGRARIETETAGRLAAGTVVPLDADAGDPVTMYVAGQRVGLGEIVVVGDKLGFRVTALELEPFARG